MRLELPVKCPRFCFSVHRERYLSYFIDEWQCFLSTFLYKLKNALYEQPQIGTFSKRLHRQWRCISQTFMLSIRNSRLLHQLRMDFEWIGSFVWLFLPIHTSMSSFNQNMANVKMQDAYLLRNNPKGHWFSNNYCWWSIKEHNFILTIPFTRNCKCCRQMSFKKQIIIISKTALWFSSVVLTFHCACFSWYICTRV